MLPKSELIYQCAISVACSFTILDNIKQLHAGNVHKGNYEKVALRYDLQVKGYVWSSCTEHD